MANPSKQKGTAAETAVVNYLHERGFVNVERRALAGQLDKGDIAGLAGFAVEVKACKAMQLASWVAEAQVEAFNAHVPYGVVWHKRTGRSQPADWYVTMTGATFVDLAWHVPTIQAVTA